MQPCGATHTAPQRSKIADVTASLRDALAAISLALEGEHGFPQTVAAMERDLAHALGAASVTIAFVDEEPERISNENARETFVLTIDGRKLGTVSYAFLEQQPLDVRDILQSLVSPISVALAWRERTTERDRLQTLMRTDPLTNLANRMAFDERLDAVWRRSRDSRRPLSVALLDIDYFKIYNDTYGHVAGDECLRDVGRKLAEQAAKEGGLIARYGGEEFAFVSDDMQADEAIAVVGRFMRAFEDRPIVHRGSTLGRISLSAGIASLAPSSTHTIADLVIEADRSLYRAKALGRNRICSGTYVSKAAVASRNAHSLVAPPVFEDPTVGREADLLRIVAAMRQVRMISLVGPAGIGKSRLAALAGAAAQQTLTDGVAYADFAMSTSDADPAGLIGTALDLVMETGDTRAELIDALRERDTLLVLDNVADSSARAVADLCADLLAVAPALSVLVTSRAALGCAAERTVVVTPLREDAAIELLRLRTGSNDLAALRELSRGFDGNPAAIERATQPVAM